MASLALEKKLDELVVKICRAWKPIPGEALLPLMILVGDDDKDKLRWAATDLLVRMTKWKGADARRLKLELEDVVRQTM